MLTSEKYTLHIDFVSDNQETLILINWVQWSKGGHSILSWNGLTTRAVWLNQILIAYLGSSMFRVGTKHQAPQCKCFVFEINGHALLPCRPVSTNLDVHILKTGCEGASYEIISRRDVEENCASSIFDGPRQYSRRLQGKSSERTVFLLDDYKWNINHSRISSHLFSKSLHLKVKCHPESRIIVSCRFSYHPEGGKSCEWSLLESVWAASIKHCCSMLHWQAFLH